MTTFDELKRRYMGGAAGGGGSIGSSSPPPAVTTHQGCQVIPHIHGRSYFAALKSRINALGTNGVANQFIYIAGWWLDPAFSLDGASGVRLVDLLIQKARAGVDVRVLGWVLAPEVLQSSLTQGARDAEGMLNLNRLTMEFINGLRAEPALANKACLNILSHPAGAVHLKMAIVGTPSQAVGFTGGLDFRGDRHNSNWHDVQAQVSGPALQGLYDTYRQMWNEIRGRPTVRLSASGMSCDSHRSGMPDLPAQTVTGAAGSLHVQSLRTLPRFRFSPSVSLGSSLGLGLPTNTPLSYAPNGLFEIKEAWQRGIGAAQKYIYIEDQGFWSREVFDWINAAVRANDQLRVVLLGGQADPNDRPSSLPEKLFRVAVNNHLIRGLNAAQLARVGLFSHEVKTIHTKSTIVDDLWAIVGSANCMRRSLYTDFEHSVAYMDPDSRLVAEYRRDLWGVHLGEGIPDLNTGLGRWFAIPFRGAGPVGPTNIVRLRLPLPATTLTVDEQAIYDQISDPDSREAWGGALVDMYMRQHGVGSMSP